MDIATLDSALEDIPGVATSTNASILRTVRDRGVGAAIWRRSPEPSLAYWLETIADRNLPHGRILVSLIDLQKAVPQLVMKNGLPPSRHTEQLAADIIFLAQCFAFVSDESQVDIRLETITDDACWKFHYDHVPLRLVVTYRGPGTQFVPRDHYEAAMSEQTHYRGPLHDISGFTAAIFKGSLAEQGGILHRSPPISGTGQSRLLLCLNVPTAVSPPLWPSVGAPFADLARR